MIPINMTDKTFKKDKKIKNENHHSNISIQL